MTINAITVVAVLNIALPSGATNPLHHSIIPLFHHSLSKALSWSCQFTERTDGDGAEDRQWIFLQQVRRVVTSDRSVTLNGFPHGLIFVALQPGVTK